MSDQFPPMNQPPPSAPTGYPPAGVPPPQKRNWVLPVLVGCGALFALAAIVTLGGLMWLGTVSPDTKAVKGSAMEATDIQTLRDLGYLQADENIIYFYSDGLLDIAEEGAFFTERRVVQYEEGDSAADIDQATYEEIADIELEEVDSWIDNSTVVVERNDGSAMYLEVSTEDDGDRKFHSRLVQEWKKHRG